MLELTKLPYQYTELEPYIDAKTVEIHYDKHHRTYNDNLNKLIEANPTLQNKTLEEIIKGVNILPNEIQRAVINSAGQVFNHDQYWLSMSHKIDQRPTGIVLEKLLKVYGTFEGFKEEWKNAGLTQFGSGWVFLVVNADGEFEIQKTSNADNPLFRSIKPVLTMDVWEHAYYLTYQNRRADYIDNYFKVLNWEMVSTNYSANV